MSAHAFVSADETERVLERDDVDRVDGFPRRPLYVDELLEVRESLQDRLPEITLWVAPRPAVVELGVRVGGEFAPERRTDRATIVSFVAETSNVYQPFSYGVGPGGEWTGVGGTIVRAPDGAIDWIQHAPTSKDGGATAELWREVLEGGGYRRLSAVGDEEVRV